MATVQDVVNEAFLDLGVIAVNETPSTAMSNDAFLRLNQLLGSLSAEGLTVPNQVEQQFPLISGFTAYTLGPGGSFGTAARAQKVTSWRAGYQGVLQSGGRVLSMAEFGEQAVQVLGETSAIPKLVAADTAYPLINVRVFPPPSTTPGVIELGFWTPLTPFVALTDVVNLAPGMEDMLHFNLARRLYPQYPRPSNMQHIWDMADRTKQALITQNAMSAPQPQPAAPKGQQ